MGGWSFSGFSYYSLPKGDLSFPLFRQSLFYHHLRSDSGIPGTLSHASHPGVGSHVGRRQQGHTSFCPRPPSCSRAACLQTRTGGREGSQGALVLA